jgi:hypothetical protein
MFMTIEDETGVANIVVRPSLFEKQRRVVLGSAMMAINGKPARRRRRASGGATDVRSDQRSGKPWRAGYTPVPTGRGDEFAHGSPGSPDSRDRPPMGAKVREIYVPDLHIDTLKVKAGIFSEVGGQLQRRCGQKQGYRNTECCCRQCTHGCQLNQAHFSCAAFAPLVCHVQSSERQ